jgi:uncharacterized protein
VIRGAGTALNIASVVAGSGVGMLLGHRLPTRTRDVVTDGLGLVTLLAAALSAAAVLDPPLEQAVGRGGPLLVVLGALLVGGGVGSLLGLEERLAALGPRLHRRFSRAAPAGDEHPGRHRFAEGFMTASLVFCVGPLTVLGSIDDGLGHGIQQLALKSTLDGFAAIAFAATFGVGVMASALTIAVVQGGFTLVGLLLGDVLPVAGVSALTATGGLLLVGVALRLLRVRDVPVADLLPALLVAPLLTALVTAVR